MSLFRKVQWSSVIATLVFATSMAEAAKLASSCTLMDGDKDAKIEGLNPNKRLPIASVSKLATTWWSLTQKGLDYRFRTTFHVTQLGGDEYDVHIEGSRDPYFGRESLHYAISELNRLGIKKVSKLSYDENFKFFWSVNSNTVAASHYTTSSPSVAVVQRQLEPAANLTKGWAETLKYAKANKINLTAKPEFKVREIVHVPRSEFKPLAETRHFTMKSSPLRASLKEMNRNSNNHAANQIFEHMGGAKAFQAFVQTRLGLDSSQVRYLNGSGDRVDTDNGAAYNEASCSATLKMIRSMRNELKKNGKDLQHVMAVAGKDTSSTTSRIYNNDVTAGALIAKTGTVNPDITLAGILHTQQGDVYFMYNYATKGTRGDWNSARKQIKVEVTKLMRQYKGSDPIKYSPIQFMSFDAGSVFAEKETAGSKP